MGDLEQARACNWPPYHEVGRPVWFWVIENVNSDLSNLGMGAGSKKEFIQELKSKSLESLNMRGSMLNLREKHIPRIQEIYKSLLDGFISQE